ncbi:MAG: hypothetical protein QNK37_04655 [Acidobacteriota bacterium]|nr:hypothetical protein [Acidobacteriota bacterium]
MTFLLLLITAGGLPVAPIMQVDDTQPYSGDKFLSYPHDALYTGKRL